MIKSGFKTAGLAALVAASTSAAFAGGLDRSGQSVDILFESGNYGEFSFGYVNPTVTGLDPFATPTGNMALSYNMVNLGVKVDLGEKFSLALVYDQPFGADIAYPAGSFYSGIEASVGSNALTAVGAYNISDRFSVFGGVTAQQVSALLINPLALYTLEVDPATGYGYLAGAAFQIPDIALRVALTYRSEVSSINDTFELGFFSSTMNITTPQSLNLEFQTGLNPKTLLFGSIRWVDWSAFTIDAPLGGTVLSYDSDVITYSLGVGRKLTDNLSVAVTAGYEKATGGTPSVLSPTDGNISLGLGMTYTMDNAKFTLGVRKIWVGDVSAPAFGSFTDNGAIAIGGKVSFEF